MSPTDSVFTEILTQAASEARPLDGIVPHVYDELRSLARRELASDRPGHTLSTTALIHEAYVRLADADRVTDRGRAYFFAAAARAMRQILVDYARRRNRLKRGGGLAHVTLDGGLVAGEIAGSDELLDLDEALQQLSRIAERAATVVECRFFGGLSVEETGVALGVTPRTVKRDWVFARAWLYERLESGEDDR